MWDARLPGVNTFFGNASGFSSRILLAQLARLFRGDFSWFASWRMLNEATAKGFRCIWVIWSIFETMNQAVKWNSMIFNQMLKREFVEQAGQGICNFVCQGQFRITFRKHLLTTGRGVCVAVTWRPFWNIPIEIYIPFLPSLWLASCFILGPTRNDMGFFSTAITPWN